MPYQSTGKCRFYVSILQWLDSLGKLEHLPQWDYDTENDKNLVRINPASQTSFVGTGDGTEDYNQQVLRYKNTLNTFDKLMPNEQNFFMVLGHNFATTGVKGLYTKENGNTYSPLAISPYVNWTAGDDTQSATYDGFSIAVGNNAGDNTTDSLALYFRHYANNLTYKLSSFLYGTYWESPFSPDLKLTLGYDTGTKNIETKGGASLSNTMWRPPMWGDTLGPWELSDPDSPTTGQTLAHSSRRIWKLSFSFLSQENIFPKYNALNRYANTEDLDSADLLLTEGETLSDSDDFFSQVWNRCTTALPFIFQPDKDVPEFAICKFTKPISFQQTAPGLYQISNLEIREAW